MTSMLEETKWYWRQGLKRLPIHSRREGVQEFQTMELYTAVSDELQAQKMMQELSQKGIRTSSKRTRSPNDLVPPDTLIVYADSSASGEDIQEKENIEKLKTYIFSKGGHVYDNTPKVSPIKSFIFNLFRSGRK